jgi:hypothetical protein
MAAARTATAKGNLEKARRTWQSMSPQARSKAQPDGRRRAKPGTTGRGNYFHIEVRPRGEFQTFRTQDVGKPGGIQRVAGKRGSGSWDTQKWLIGKDQAHVERGRLVPDTEGARGVLESLGSAPTRVQADRFKAKSRPNVPEREKPTQAQRSAQHRNIKIAQAARRRRS